MRLPALTISFVLFLLICFTGSAQYGNFGLLKKSIDGRFQVYAEDKETAQIAKKQVRQLYEKIIESLNYTGAFKTKYRILIWSDQDLFKSFLKSNHIGSKANAMFLTSFRGYPTILAHSPSKFPQKALLHEFCHLVIREVTGKKKIPLWLDEGLANRMGSPMLPTASDFLKEKIAQNQHIKLSELIDMRKYPKDSKEKTLFYIESESLVDFLFSRQKKKGVFYSFLRRYVNQNNPFNRAYAHAYNQKSSLKSLEKEWLQHISNF
jgi:peptidase MA superfamily protein